MQNGWKFTSNIRDVLWSKFNRKQKKIVVYFVEMTTNATTYDLRTTTCMSSTTKSECETES